LNLNPADMSGFAVEHSGYIVEFLLPVMLLGGTCSAATLGCAKGGRVCGACVVEDSLPTAKRSTAH